MSIHWATHGPSVSFRAAAGSAVLAVLPVAALMHGCVNGDTEARATGAPKVVLLIGDGMDDQQITIARNYLVGSAGELTLDGMPFRGAVQVQAIAEDDPTRPSYISDSANTATSMATGVLTSSGRIATTARTDEDLVTIMELARDAGLGTGIVTTSSLTDATPAAFAAHVNQRFCQGPRDMLRRIERLRVSVDCSQDYKANGGRGSIAEQVAAAGVNVLLGGGANHFDELLEGSEDQTIAAAARADGYEVIRSRDELLALSSSASVLGLFAADTMPVKWRGEGGAQAVRVEHVDGQVRLPEPYGCEPNPRFEGTPTLAEMTRAALRRLDGSGGFMLMIESASIDKQSHLRRPCGHIGELGQLDETLALVLEYARAHPETLVLVTADHSHAAQIVPDGGNFLALNFASPGYFARVRTPEGSVMGINYATNDSPIQEYHTGAEVPIFASGPGVEELPAFVRQTDIFAIAADHLGLDGSSTTR